jgi:hypothetical protein
MRNVDATLLNGTDAALAQNTPPMIVDQIIAYAFQGTIALGGTATGTFKLQASCDSGRTPRGDGVVNWVDIAGATGTLSLASPIMINVQNPGYKWVRAVWTPTSGTGAITVRMTGKGDAA